MNWALVAAGALTGFVVGVTGVGGGSLMTPLLLLVFGVAPSAAVGTDLWFSGITKIFAARVSHEKNLVDWQVARRMWLGSLTGSVATTLALRSFTTGADTQHVLRMAIGISICVTSLGLLLQKPLHTLGHTLRTTHVDSFKAAQLPLTVLAGLVLGVLITLTSVGAGALGVVMLTYLYPLRLTPQRLVATDIVHAIPLTLVAGVGHLFLGDVDPVLLCTLLVGSIPLVIAGAVVSSKLPALALRIALSVVLVCVALKMLLS